MEIIIAFLLLLFMCFMIFALIHKRINDKILKQVKKEIDEFLIINNIFWFIFNHFLKLI